MTDVAESSTATRSVRRVKSEGDALPSTSSAPLTPEAVTRLSETHEPPAPPSPVHFSIRPQHDEPPHLEPISTSPSRENETAPSHEEDDLTYPIHAELRPNRIRRLMSWLGVGRHATKARRLVSALIWNLSWSFVQVVVIITLVAISARTVSPTEPPSMEWDACERPLGVWACLWLARLVLSTSVSVWGYNRQMTRLRQNGEILNGISAEIGNAPSNSAASGITPSRPGRAPSSSRSSRTRSSSNRAEGRQSDRDDQPPLPHARAFARLSTLSSLLSVTWFITAHILEYTSVYTCRLSSPHLWWLIFGILAIMYFMILELVLLGLFFFIVLPIVFVFWNLFLLMFGRHPLLNPRVIKPDIDKLPSSIVDKIPLVMYMPFPPDAPEDVVKKPEVVYTYPPKNNGGGTESPTSKRRWSRFLRIRKKNDKESAGSEAELPFVMLEGNRAVCSICLCDFEEVKKPSDEATQPEATVTQPQNESKPREEAETNDDYVIAYPVEDVAEERREDGLQLEDAGEGAQPLRLLPCGHVFHKTCLDPWLLNVSGRCPVCQRKVELPLEFSKGKKARRVASIPNN